MAQKFRNYGSFHVLSYQGKMYLLPEDSYRQALEIAIDRPSQLLDWFRLSGDLRIDEATGELEKSKWF